MILAWPLTTSAEIAQVLRPGQSIQADSALRALRQLKLSPSPISAVRRSERGVRGRTVFYSSLTLDVARLGRSRRLAAAAAANSEAQRLATHRSAQFVAEYLADHLDAGPGDAAVIDEATGGALSRLAVLTTMARSRLGDLGVSMVLIDRQGVASGAGMEGSVWTDVAPSTETFVRHLHRAGFSLPGGAGFSGTTSATPEERAIDVEATVGGATMIWERPAFEPAPDPHARVAIPEAVTSPKRARTARSLR